MALSADVFERAASGGGHLHFGDLHAATVTGGRRSEGQTRGSLEWSAICSRTASRRRTISCQSDESLDNAFAEIGGDRVIVMDDGRGRIVPSRRKLRVPASETGTMGAPVTTAALKAPS